MAEYLDARGVQYLVALLKQYVASLKPDYTDHYTKGVSCEATSETNGVKITTTLQRDNGNISGSTTIPNATADKCGVLTLDSIREVFMEVLSEYNPDPAIDIRAGISITLNGDGAGIYATQNSKLHLGITHGTEFIVIPLTKQTNQNVYYISATELSAVIGGKIRQSNRGQSLRISKCQSDGSDGWNIMTGYTIGDLKNKGGAAVDISVDSLENVSVIPYAVDVTENDLILDGNLVINVGETNYFDITIALMDGSSSYTWSTTDPVSSMTIRGSEIVQKLGLKYHNNGNSIRITIGEIAEKTTGVYSTSSSNITAATKALPLQLYVLSSTGDTIRNFYNHYISVTVFDPDIVSLGGYAMLRIAYQNCSFAITGQTNGFVRTLNKTQITDVGDVAMTFDGTGTGIKDIYIYHPENYDPQSKSCNISVQSKLIGYESESIVGVSIYGGFAHLVGFYKNLATNTMERTYLANQSAYMILTNTDSRSNVLTLSLDRNLPYLPEGDELSTNALYISYLVTEVDNVVLNMNLKGSENLNLMNIDLSSIYKSGDEVYTHPVWVRESMSKLQLQAQVVVRRKPTASRLEALFQIGIEIYDTKYLTLSGQIEFTMMATTNTEETCTAKEILNVYRDIR